MSSGPYSEQYWLKVLYKDSFSLTQRGCFNKIENKSEAAEYEGGPPKIGKNITSLYLELKSDDFYTSSLVQLTVLKARK